MSIGKQIVMTKLYASIHVGKRIMEERRKELDRNGKKEKYIFVKTSSLKLHRLNLSTKAKYTIHHWLLVFLYHYKQYYITRKLRLQNAQTTCHYFTRLKRKVIVTLILFMLDMDNDFIQYQLLTSNNMKSIGLIKVILIGLHRAPFHLILTISKQ